MRFNILDALLQRKGGYVDNANDRGGPTMYGITRTTALQTSAGTWLVSALPMTAYAQLQTLAVSAIMPP